mgnify:CR=1 FL=1|tara:strand:+ start:413 stop:532 length:120 start_codon:yes stop_codon:yes gene_type:complete
MPFKEGVSGNPKEIPKSSLSATTKLISDSIETNEICLLR